MLTLCLLTIFIVSGSWLNAGTFSKIDYNPQVTLLSPRYHRGIASDRTAPFYLSFGHGSFFGKGSYKLGTGFQVGIGIHAPVSYLFSVSLDIGISGPYGSKSGKIPLNGIMSPVTSDGFLSIGSTLHREIPLKKGVYLCPSAGLGYSILTISGTSPDTNSYYSDRLIYPIGLELRKRFSFAVIGFKVGYTYRGHLFTKQRPDLFEKNFIYLGLIWRSRWRVS